MVAVKGGACAVVLCLLAGVRPAFCGTCPVPEGAAAALSARDVEARRLFLGQAVASEASAARSWLLGWGLGHGALLSGNLVLAEVGDRSARPDRIVAASAAGVGLLATQLGRHGALRASRQLEALAGTSCAALAEAEAAFVQLAEDDRRTTAWYMHAVNVAFNVGMGLILGLGYDRWGPAALQMGVGSAVGEALILTRPTAAIDALARYRAGELSPPSSARVVPLLVATPGSVLLGAAATF